MPKLSSNALGGSPATKMNTSATTTSQTKRTGRVRSKFLKLGKLKGLTISAPATAVTVKATTNPGRPGSRHSVDAQMNADTTAAAEGLGSPSK